MKNIILFKFKPTKEIFVVLASWVAVVSAFYLAFNIFTTKMVALNFITFGVIGITLLGIAAPVLYTVLVRKRPLSDLGITKDNLVVSIVLGLAFSIVQYFMTLRNIEIPSMAEFTPLVTMSLAVGLYENIFFRGWVQRRMEEYFGAIPAILLSAVIYALYHIGYGMGTGEMVTLFIIGLVYSTIFRLTSNIFILYPFLTPTGALFSQLKEGLRLPLQSILGFADVIIVCVILLVFVSRIGKGKRVRRNKLSTEQAQ